MGSSSSSSTVNMVQPAQMYQAEVSYCCILQVVPAGQETIATEAENENKAAQVGTTLLTTFCPGHMCSAFYIYNYF